MPQPTLRLQLRTFPTPPAQQASPDNLAMSASCEKPRRAEEKEVMYDAIRDREVHTKVLGMKDKEQHQLLRLMNDLTTGSMKNQGVMT
jgi:hypothetical protein